MDFREFARVELWDGRRNGGTFWYQISDHTPRHVYFDTTFNDQAFQWMDSTDPHSSTNLEPMNLLKISFIFTFLLIIGDARSRTIPSDIEIASMSIEGAGQLIDPLASVQGIRDLADAVLRTRRLDLVSLYFHNGLMMGSIVDGAASLPDSSYKDHIVVMILKSADSWYWPPGKEALAYGYTWTPRMQEPFTSVIKKLRPKLPVSDALLADRDSRLKLALELEKAIVSEPVQPNPKDARTDSLPEPSVIERPTPSRLPTANAAPSTVTSDTEHTRIKSWRWPWIVGSAALIVLVTILWKRKSH